MKHFVLIASLLVVGCSQEQDTRLVCSCTEAREVKHNAQFADLSGLIRSDMSYPVSCDEDSKDGIPLVFNESKKKLSFSTGLYDEDLMFSDEVISGGFMLYSSEWNAKIRFNRISLKAETDVVQGFWFEDGEPEKVYGTVLDRDYYQCKVVDGV